MGTWSVIRKATEEDYNKLEARAQAFCTRHDIDIADYYDNIAGNLWDVLAYDAIHRNNPQQASYLLSLWKRIVKRALGHRWAEGISHGTIGFTVN